MADDTTDTGTSFDNKTLLTGGVGALGLASILSTGEGSLPAQYSQLGGMVSEYENEATALRNRSSDIESYVPTLRGKASALEATGSALVGQGQEALAAANRGEVTAGQQAKLDATRAAEQNKARQMFSNMGLNADQTTSYLTESQQIDQNILIAAQNYIDSNVKTALSTISSGATLTQEGLSFESAATSEESLSLNAYTSSLGFQNAAATALTTAGQAQLTLDTNYSNSLTNAFTSIGKMFGQAALVAA